MAYKLVGAFVISVASAPVHSADFVFRCSKLPEQFMSTGRGKYLSNLQRMERDSFYSRPVP